MKKFISVLFELLAVFGFLAGLYYLYQKYILKDDISREEFDDDFDDDDFDDKDFTETGSDSREYVTLNSSESKALSNDDSISNDDFDEISD